MLGSSEEESPVCFAVNMSLFKRLAFNCTKLVSGILDVFTYSNPIFM